MSSLTPIGGGLSSAGGFDRNRLSAVGRQLARMDNQAFIEAHRMTLEADLRHIAVELQTSLGMSTLTASTTVLDLAELLSRGDHNRAALLSPTVIRVLNNIVDAGSGR